LSESTSSNLHCAREFLLWGIWWWEFFYVVCVGGGFPWKLDRSDLEWFSSVFRLLGVDLRLWHRGSRYLGGGGADFHFAQFGNLGIRSSKQGVQQIREHMDLQYVSVHQESMGTKPIHVQAVFEFTNRMFGDIAAFRIESMVDVATVACHVRHHIANVATTRFGDLDFRDDSTCVWPRVRSVIVKGMEQLKRLPTRLPPQQPCVLFECPVRALN